MITRACDIAFPGSYRTQLSLWKAFGTQRETAINVLQLLMGILEKTHPREEQKEMAFQPVAVSTKEGRGPWT